MIRAKAVTIAGTRYRVAGATTSGSRGREYMLADDEGHNIRTCHAPAQQVAGAYTGGEHIEYHWRTK
jgi:hypothetical protein